CQRLPLSRADRPTGRRAGGVAAPPGERGLGVAVSASKPLPFKGGDGGGSAERRLDGAGSLLRCSSLFGAQTRAPLTPPLKGRGLNLTQIAGPSSAAARLRASSFAAA